MLRGLYSSISSMVTLQSKQSVVSNNLANINTSGYKEESLITKAFDDVLLSNYDNYKNGEGHYQELGTLNFGVRIDDTITNHKQGTHKATENKTDFALDGKGFFQVRDAGGKTYYTRDGSFKVNSQGYLVTNGGHFVMGENLTNGNIEPIYIGNGNISVNSNNYINLNGTDAYRFRVMDFNNYENLRKSGDNLYYSDNPIQADNYYVKQGYLETSNVDMINTTAQLMEIVKEFEANQKIVQTIDSTLSKIANEIGSVR